MMKKETCYQFRCCLLAQPQVLLLVAVCAIQTFQPSFALVPQKLPKGLASRPSIAFSSTIRSSKSNSCDSDSFCSSRRTMLQGCLGILAGATTETSLQGVRPVSASETIGKDPDCNDSTCLGVWDGLLADCPHTSNFGGLLGGGGGGGAGCTSSQDDTPGIFSEPWDYSDAPTSNLDQESQMNLIVTAIQLVSSRRGDQVNILVRKGPYLRVLFQDGKSNEKSVGEFYFTENDTTVQYRLASLGGGTGGPASALSGGIRNIERSELIRKELKFLKVPVIRNRQRTLLFFESDLDTFGPGSAALGSPGDMNARDFDSEKTYPNYKMDVTQQFPMQR